MQKQFLFDPNKCDGCHACQIACIIENNLQPENSWRSIYTFNERHIPSMPVYHLSLACNHCLEAPCLKYCPSLAYSRNESTGFVVLDAEKCIGCKYCSWQCPYDAPKYNNSLGIMQKCTFCDERISSNKEPACVTACPTNALNINKNIKIDTDRFIAGFPDIKIKPSIVITPLRNRGRTPKISSSENVNYENKILKDLKLKHHSSKSVKSEITLLSFTYLTTIAVSVFTFSLISGKSIPIWFFFSISFLSVALGIFHLGKKARAYRVILNWKNSWLSREIIFFSGFITFMGIFLLFFQSYEFTGWIASISGFATLFSIDRIYNIKSRIQIFDFHSAETFYTGLFLVFVLTNNTPLFVIFMIFKLTLYFIRKFLFLKNFNIWSFITLVRLIIGILLPAAFYLMEKMHFSHVALLLILVGELIDRAEFYYELEFTSPLKTIDKDLKEWKN